MLSYKTAGFNGYAVKYSPFYDNKIAVAAGANYGLVGNGKLYIFSILPNGQLQQDNSFLTQDGLFDVAWSECHENQCITAQGDGSVRLFDISKQQFPVGMWREHQREVFSVTWDGVGKRCFASSAWDGTVKVWSVDRPQSMLTIPADRPRDHLVGTKQQQTPMGTQARPPAAIASQQTQTQSQSNAECIYQTTYSPHNPTVLMSASSSSQIRLYDLRSARPTVKSWTGHSGNEALTCDFNKYESHLVASAGVDRSVRIWDLRMIPDCDGSHVAPHSASRIIRVGMVNELFGHELAVRKVAWSPHSSTSLLSASYDMSCRTWNVTTGSTGVFHGHREFAMGCDWSMWGEPGWCASVGWDEMVYVWDAKRIRH